MKVSNKNIFLSSVFMCSTLVAYAVNAETHLMTENPHYGEKGWEVEAGVGIGKVSNWVYKTNEDNKGFVMLNLNARYYGENLYFVADDEEGLLLGYNASKSEKTAIDVVLAPRFAGWHDDNELLNGMNKRDIDLHAGIRYTQYLDDSLYKIEVSNDISGAHSGSIFSATYEKEWQQKNWIITGLVSAIYVSEKMADYYFGVSSSEATAEYPVHKVDANLLLGLGAKAEYPINENWVFKAAVSHLISDGEVSDSPITLDENNISTVSATMTYHF